jgi:hypothetical protein
MIWRIAAASAIGTSHTKTGQPCQDSARAILVDSPDGSSVFVCAVADGAGSAAHSEIGSRAAVTTATFLVEHYLKAGGTISSIKRETAYSWLAQIQAVISDFAMETNVSTREFACTLLVGIIGINEAVFFQIGDGAMVVLETGDDAWSYVFWPQHGEYINSTNFITSSDAQNLLEFASVSRNIESFSAFSDGIESLVLHYGTKTVHDRFFNSMIKPVRESTTKGMNLDLSEGLLKYLNSERVCERTDDDKSLVLATRSYQEQQSQDDAAP